MNSDSTAYHEKVEKQWQTWLRSILGGRRSVMKQDMQHKILQH